MNKSTLVKFTSKNSGKEGYIYSLKTLKNFGLDVSRLPVSIKIVLESVLRNSDGQRATDADVKRLAAWSATEPADYEVPFVVSRIVLQDFTGVPLLVDLAAMRDAAKAQGKKIVAVGTTTVRTLESAFKIYGEIKACKSASNLFIYPPYEFKIVDNLITNFHLPKSTLLMLVSALASREFIFEAYAEAVKEKYRFYSYGDCMFIS